MPHPGVLLGGPNRWLSGTLPRQGPPPVEVKLHLGRKAEEMYEKFKSWSREREKEEGFFFCTKNRFASKHLLREPQDNRKRAHVSKQQMGWATSQLLSVKTQTHTALDWIKRFIWKAHTFDLRQPKCLTHNCWQWEQFQSNFALVPHWLYKVRFRLCTIIRKEQIQLHLSFHCGSVIQSSHQDSQALDVNHFTIGW